MVKRKEIKRILKLSSLGPSSKSRLIDCELIDLMEASSLALTVRCNFEVGATGGMRVHLVASPDTSVFDTQDYTSFDVAVEAGKEAQKTVAITPDIPYLKVILENLDTAKTITDIDVFAILGFEE